jgi:hypothetical protein
VKTAILPALLLCFASGPALGQAGRAKGGGAEEKPLTVEVGPEVKQSAAAAVNELGKQVVLGNHKIAIDRMYGPWKEYLAKQTPGGMAKLEQASAELVKQMAQQQISIISSKVEVSKPYEVDAGKEVVLENGKPVIDKASGKPVEKLVFKKWLLIVPTESEIRIMPPATPGQPPPKIEVWVNHSFQVAISDKGKNDWTFIDGSAARVPELRRMFFNLSRSMELPEIKAEKKEAK